MAKPFVYRRFSWFGLVNPGQIFVCPVQLSEICEICEDFLLGPLIDFYFAFVYV